MSTTRKPYFSADGAYVGKAATDITAQKNAAWFDRLDFDDESEKENALRGLIEAPEALEIYDAKGEVVWSTRAYEGMATAEKIPATVNPSLWRNTLYNTYAGLFEVTDGIYQVRGYDMANITFIRCDHGWIVFDVLMSREDAEASMKLMEKHFGPINVVAVLISHSHVDHFGGIEGVIKREDVADRRLSLEDQLASGKVPVIVPEKFLKYAVSENLYAGPGMGRRAHYQYGAFLPHGYTGKMCIGIGMGQSYGMIALVAPSYEVKTDETVNIDGVEIKFQLTPGTEAPAEMNAYFPAYRGLWMAENCCGTLHNIYTLRGAEVRDALHWAKYIMEADARFGDKTDVVFQSHNWPHWGTDNIHAYLKNTAAVYKFIHDQTLAYANEGYTANEISHMIELPEKLDKVWYTRQYYGTVSHDARAVYQRYLGFYSANPADLNPLTPTETAAKWVEYLGDVDKVLDKAQADFEAGQYQWVAQLTRELVFADPENERARELGADALEQLGYQAESGTWRNCYLMGAMELRLGNRSAVSKRPTGIPDMVKAMTCEQLLDYLSIHNDTHAAESDDLVLNLHITDTDEIWRVERTSGVILYNLVDKPAADAEATISCPNIQLVGIFLGVAQLDPAQIQGDATALARLLKYQVNFINTFNIVTP